MIPRRRDGGFNNNVELMVIVMIIGILAAIAIPSFVNFRAKRGATCLGHLVATMDGKRPADATCPYSGTAYAKGDVASCPTPADHFDSKPAFRKSDDAWTLEQTLPAYDGKPFVLAGNSELQGDVVHVKPNGLMKYVFGPLISLIMAIITLACVSGMIEPLKKKNWPDAVFMGVITAFCAWLSWASLPSWAESHTWAFEKGKATRTEYLFGSTRKTETWTGCLGVVPIPSGGAGGRMLQLVHAERAGVRHSPVETIPRDRLDVAAWINRALEGPPADRPE